MLRTSQNSYKFRVIESNFSFKFIDLYHQNPFELYRSSFLKFLEIFEKIFELILNIKFLHFQNFRNFFYEFKQLTQVSQKKLKIFEILAFEEKTIQLQINVIYNFVY